MQRMRSIGLSPGPGMSIASSATKIRPSGAHSTTEGHRTIGGPCTNSTFHFSATLGMPSEAEYLTGSAAETFAAKREIAAAAKRREIFGVMMTSAFGMRDDDRSRGFAIATIP